MSWKAKVHPLDSATKTQLLYVRSTKHITTRLMIG